MKKQQRKVVPDVGPRNLKHVLDGECTDPDCELHHIDVALEESLVSDTNLAYWLAGVEFAIVTADPVIKALVRANSRLLIRDRLREGFETRTVETDLLEDR